MRACQEYQRARRSQVERSPRESRGGEWGRSTNVSSTIVPLYERESGLPSYLTSQWQWTELRDSIDSWWSTEASAGDTGVELRAIESGLGTSERSGRQTNLAYFEELRPNNNWSIRGATRFKMVKKVRSDPMLAPRLKNEHASPRGSTVEEKTRETQPLTTSESNADPKSIVPSTMSATAQGSAINTMPVTRDNTQPTTAQSSSMNVDGQTCELTRKMRSSSWARLFPPVPTDEPAIGSSSSAPQRPEVVYSDGQDEIYSDPWPEHGGPIAE